MSSFIIRAQISPVPRKCSLSFEKSLRDTNPMRGKMDSHKLLNVPPYPLALLAAGVGKTSPVRALWGRGW